MMTVLVCQQVRARREMTFLLNHVTMSESVLTTFNRITYTHIYIYINSEIMVFDIHLYDTSIKQVTNMNTPLCVC